MVSVVSPTPPAAREALLRPPPRHPHVVHRVGVVPLRVDTTLRRRGHHRRERDNALCAPRIISLVGSAHGSSG